jgi:hypothetical protein
MDELQPKTISRDEMNLAEFPLTVLSTRADPRLKTLEFSDTIKTKNGDLIERRWLITGADKFGLPTSSDDEVLLGLLKLTVDDGIQNRKVHFTRYELLKTLRWSTEGRSYSRLQKALDRLAGLRIKATNAFFDNDAKCHSTKVFGLIDAYEINTSRDADLKSSYFTWSETIFKSFQVGFIKKLDLDFYLSLNSAVSKRLYRFLDKHFWYKTVVDINIFTLAHEKLGISRNYKFASSLRQQLDPALTELCKEGFVETYSYAGRGGETRLTVVAKRGVRSIKVAEKSSKSLAEQSSILNSPVNSSVSRSLSAVEPQPYTKGATVGINPTSTTSRVGNSNSLVLPDGLLKETVTLLVKRGLKEGQVLKLVGGKGSDALRRIQGIIGYFDALVETGSHLVSKSPVGFLYRAVENYQTFTIPKKLPKAVKVPPVSARTRQDIEKEVTASLAKIRPHLSESNYQKVFSHTVIERMQREGIEHSSSHDRLF